MTDLFVPVEITFTSNPKIKHAASLLGIKHVHMSGHLIHLWTWTMVHARDGMLEQFEVRELASAAEWDGDGGVFINALIQAELLDPVPLSIHDWEEHTGWLDDGEFSGPEYEATLDRIIATAVEDSKRDLNRERQRRFRERHKDDDKGETNSDPSSAKNHVTQSSVTSLSAVTQGSVTPLSAVTQSSVTSLSARDEPHIREGAHVREGDAGAPGFRLRTSNVERSNRDSTNHHHHHVKTRDADMREREGHTHTHEGDARERATDDGDDLCCQFETELGEERIGILVDLAGKMSIQLDRRWLITTLRVVHADVGDLPAKVIAHRIRVAFDSLKRLLAVPVGQKGAIITPAPYARRVLLTSFKER